MLSLYNIPTHYTHTVENIVLSSKRIGTKDFSVELYNTGAGVGTAVHILFSLYGLVISHPWLLMVRAHYYSIILGRGTHS